MLFSPENEPLEFFSLEHIIAMLVVLTIIMITFFCRKLFIKYAIADKIFRYTLAFGLIAFELILQLRHGIRPLYGIIVSNTYPMCGFMIWFCSIALLANSARLMKLIYPLTITGGTLSLVVIDMSCSFPAFGAFQFFFVHAGFLLGALYFVFTRKISRFTIKDLGRSCIFLFTLSCYILLVGSGKLELNHNFTDPLFIISPPGGLGFIKDALGQTGYTLVYIMFVVGILFSIYGLTYLCTKHRPYEAIEQYPMRNCKIFNYLSDLTTKERMVTILIIFGVGLYVSVMRRVTQDIIYTYLDAIMFVILFIALVLNEMVYVYKSQQETKKIQLVTNKE